LVCRLDTGAVFADKESSSAPSLKVSSKTLLSPVLCNLTPHLHGNITGHIGGCRQKTSSEVLK
jgi:hypothetical protein